MDHTVTVGRLMEYTIIVDGIRYTAIDPVRFLSSTYGEMAEVYGFGHPHPVVFYRVPDGLGGHTWICAIPKWT